MSVKKMTEEDCRLLFHKAMDAGRKAASECVPRPMYIQGYEPVMDGVCGFAWVVVKPANCAFAKYLKKIDVARNHYQGGVSIWISDYNQSMTKKEAHARFMAEVIALAGINCYSDSRMD